MSRNKAAVIVWICSLLSSTLAATDASRNRSNKKQDGEDELFHVYGV
jgi:hypothetical protein